MMRRAGLDCLIVESDASFRRGKAGLGAIVRGHDGKRIAERTEVAHAAHSDEAERLAARLALELAASIGARQVKLRTDNNGLAHVLAGVFDGSAKKPPKWSEEFVSAARAFDRVRCDWVPRDELSAVDHLSRAYLHETPGRVRARSRLKARKALRQVRWESCKLVERLRALSMVPLDELHKIGKDYGRSVRQHLMDLKELASGLNAAMQVASRARAEQGHEWPQHDVLHGVAAA